MSHPASLSAAITHLKAFRATFDDGAVIHDDAGLTAEDLTAIIEHCERPREDVISDALGDLA